MKRSIIILTVLFCILIPMSAFAGVPLDTVKRSADEVVSVLKDPALKSEAGRNVKKKKIRAIADRMFDFTELSRRTLALNWRKLSPDQQKEFVSLFKDLLADTYADKILAYKDEKIVFTKEIPLTSRTVEVQSSVIKQNQEIPINYRVINENGTWLVYDVVVEGVSLINNYRTQFREILTNKPPSALLDTLRKKVGRSRT